MGFRSDCNWSVGLVLLQDHGRPRRRRILWVWVWTVLGSGNKPTAYSEVSPKDQAVSSRRLLFLPEKVMHVSVFVFFSTSTNQALRQARSSANRISAHEAFTSCFPQTQNTEQNGESWESTRRVSPSHGGKRRFQRKLFHHWVLRELDLV